MIPFHDLSRSHFEELQKPDRPLNHYRGKHLFNENHPDLSSIIFIDENNSLHLALQLGPSKNRILVDPNINGLTVAINHFRFSDEPAEPYIDLSCTQHYFIEEFCEVIKEVLSKLRADGSTVDCVNETLQNWKLFWSSKRNDLLDEDQIIGLSCELLVFRKICEINPSAAIQSWTGPLKSIHDFELKSWSLEIKGTRKNKHIHIINGLDQLSNEKNKKLGFISFILTETDGGAYSLQEIIDSISTEYFSQNKSLLEKFNSLLVKTGYTRVYREAYLKPKFNIFEGNFYLVDDQFPKITQDSFVKKVDVRLSEVRYRVNIEGLASTQFEEIKWGNYLI